MSFVFGFVLFRVFGGGVFFGFSKMVNVFFKPASKKKGRKENDKV